MKSQFRKAAGSNRLVYTLLVLIAMFLSACGKEPAPKTANEPASVAASAPVSAAPPASQDEPGIDPISGLVMDEGWEMVRGTCAACHSASLVTQNRGSRETWKEMIRWMQETQGLWPLDPQMENTILDYLARNYPPAASSRRAALAPELMPPNPYAEKDST